MPDPLVTLTTDFGTASPYVAAMKGVLLALNPSARILDLGHDLPPQDVGHAAHFLAGALPWFPPEALHVVVVDPGVGSDRASLYVETAHLRLLAPDNGCWTLLPGPVQRVLRLAEPRYWRPTVSATFHGRDVFAPVAGHLSLGLYPAQLGPLVTSWVRLEERPPVRTPDGWRGEVVFVDHFGNLLTNLPGELLAAATGVRVGPTEVARCVRTYADAAPGTLVALVSSVGLLEVAVVQGNAARTLGVSPGAEVFVSLLPV